MYFVFSLSFSVFLFLLVWQFLFIFLVASFDGLRPLLVTSHCSLRSLANKLRSFVPSSTLVIVAQRYRELAAIIAKDKRKSSVSNLSAAGRGRVMSSALRTADWTSISIQRRLSASGSHFRRAWLLADVAIAFDIISPALDSRKTYWSHIIWLNLRYN